MTGALAAVRGYVNARLGRRLLLVLVAVLSTVSLCFLALVIVIYRGQLIEDHARASLEVNHLLQATLENAMLKRDIPGLRQVVDRLGEQDGIAAVMILDPKGEVRFSSRKAELGQIVRDRQIATALENRRPETAFVTGADGSDWLRSVNPVANKPACKECHGTAAENPVNGLLVVDYDAAGIRRNALRTAGLLGFSGLLVILASGIGIWIAMDRLVLGRISQLRCASQDLAAGVLGARAPVQGNDEIGTCAATFNQMASRIETMLDHVATAERALQAIIDSIPDGVRVIDDAFTIVRANDAYCRQVGQPKSRVIGERCYRSSHGRQEPCPQTLTTCPVVALRDASRRTVKFTDAHRARDGAQLFVEVSAARADVPLQQGMTHCVVESIRDLSQAVDLSQKHRLSEIGLLATGVAHEIHNPLSSIELALSAIRESLVDGSVPRTHMDYIEIARTEIGKCLSVTEGLMRLSEPPRDAELVALERTLPEVMSLLAFQFEQAAIRCDLDIEDGLRVLASDSDLRMIAVNLAQNSIHAMPGGGHFGIDGRRAGASVVLRFADTGTGIPAEDLDRIFLPFWTRRADGSTGRGLGLSICKAIVERYRGTIGVASTPGEGTEFTVRLPAADAGEA
ncbi:histidine kinase [Zhengella mangrovi]|uniref:histidine kinase n=1 Tax=Zhengella mangrovi TaxID=1982044 RepID=A0A2G1QLF9_9HYPH|nr:ATP-binding protein [Zhengella mangrovi]PHP66304.1 histidine kinase [Zhengella mangrovi]